MVRIVLENSQDFLNKFDIAGTEYFDPIILTDTKYGFSIKRKYPSNSPFKPDRDASGQSKQVAAIWLVLRDKIQPEKDGRILVTARISTFNVTKSIWDDDEDNSPKEEKKRPADLEFRKDFYFDPVSQEFSRKDGQIIKGIAILDEVYRDHCNTVHPIRGIELRFKIFLREFIDSILVSLIYFLKFITENVFFTKLTTKESYFDDLPLKDNLWGFTDIPRTETEYVEFIGVKAPKKPIIILCCIICAISVAHYLCGVNFAYLKSISNQPILLAAHLILVLALLEMMPNEILRPIINWLIKLRGKFLLSRINPFSYRTWLLPLLLAVILVELICLL